MKLDADGKLAPSLIRETTREIYFVHAPLVNLVKIGVANDAAPRLRQLQGESPVPLVLLAVTPCFRGGTLERRLHQEFHHLRRHGEWFELSARLADHIESMALAYPTRLARLQAAMADDVSHRPGRPSRQNGAGTAGVKRVPKPSARTVLVDARKPL